MRVGIVDGEIIIIDPDDRYKALTQYMHWDKKTKCLRARATLDTLKGLSGIFTLTPALAALRVWLERKERELERLRNDPKPVPLVHFPVKEGITLFDHQIRAVNMAVTEFNQAEYKGFGLLFEMGLGKTLTAITIIGCLHDMRRVKRVLVVAPTSVVSVWPKDLEAFAAFPYWCKPLVGDKVHRLNALYDLMEYQHSGVNVAVVNYETVHRDWMLKALMEYNPDLIIADESQRIKTNSTKQSKAMHRLGDMARYKLILSGTPVQNNAVDLYSQYRFLNSDIFGTNFYAFKNRYCIMGGFQKHQIIGYRHEDELIKKVHSIALRVTKAEALDLPPQTFETRWVDFEPKQRKIYEQLRREGIAELENEETITATTVLTKLLRLQQFTGGFLLDESGRAIVQNTAKLDALADILEDYVVEAGQKLVVFARFTAEIKAIESLLKKKKIAFGAIHGNIPIADRGEIVKDFQENADTKVFIAQLQCAGLGITLTAASTAVYYSLNFNYADYAQSLARIHRIGQESKCHYIHLLADNTVDSKTLEALEAKGDIAKKLVDNWREYF